MTKATSVDMTTPYKDREGYAKNLGDYSRAARVAAGGAMTKGELIKGLVKPEKNLHQ